jgi:hypothetical protein
VPSTQTPSATPTALPATGTPHPTETPARLPNTGGLPYESSGANWLLLLLGLSVLAVGAGFGLKILAEDEKN